MQTNETYYESADGVTISKARAYAEVRKHEVSVEDFIAEFGERDTYAAQDVLSWLGY